MTEPLTASQLLTPEQLCDRWQIEKTHLYRLCREGRLPSVKLGKFYRFRIADIEQFEQSGGTLAEGPAS